MSDRRARRNKSRTETVSKVYSLSDDDDSEEGIVPENFPYLLLQYPGLTTKLGEVLKMGGRSFETFFEPLQMDIENVTDLQKMLTYFNHRNRLEKMICRSDEMGEKS